jgi:hypothetical protein
MTPAQIAEAQKLVRDWKPKSEIPAKHKLPPAVPSSNNLNLGRIRPH